MEISELEKLKKLDEIAENDPVYQVWARTRAQYAAAFEAFADCQSEEVRDILWGYAGAGDMMFQRKLLLACRNMTRNEQE